MLQVSRDVFAVAGSCAAASWFISINPVTSVVVKTRSCRRFLCLRLLCQASNKFERALVEIMDTTLDVEA
jgi:hypothetical protein